MRTKLVLLVPFVLSAAACATPHIPKDVVSLARETKPGGEFFIEFDAYGRVLGADAEIAVDRVPSNLVAAANAKYPGGEVVGAEKEFDGRGLLWEVVKRIDGQLWEVLVTPGGVVVGGEQALPEPAWPFNVVAAAKAATNGGTVEGCEKVWGPEARVGEAYHVKIRKDGDSLRVGVDEEGNVVRVVRRVAGQVRVPR